MHGMFILCLLEGSLVLSSFVLVSQLQVSSPDKALAAADPLLSRLQLVSLESIAPAIAVMLIIITIFYSLGLYGWRHISSGFELVSRLSVGLFLSAPILAVIYYLIPPSGALAHVFVNATGAALAMILIVRLLFHSLLGPEAFKRQIVVLGAGSLAARVADLAKCRHSGFRCAGFVPLGGEKIEVFDEPPLAKEALAQVIKDLIIDEIVIALEDRRNRLPLECLVDCRLSGVAVSDYTSFCEREMGQVDLDCLTPSWFFFDSGFQNSALERALKRTLDIISSLTLAVFFAPLMILLSVTIMASRNGSVFYCQDRVGRGGKIFRMIKFRTMRPEAEEAGAPRWTQVDDNRITRLGAFMRRIRMDELPQIFNILKGDMSLVGPRPEQPEFVEQLKALLPYYDERHRMLPGITGWAQVSFKYAGSFEETKTKLEHDLYYIKHYSIVLDLIIILQTVRVVLWREGAL